MREKKTRRFPALLLAAVLLAGCSGQKAAPVPETAAPAEESQVPAEETAALPLAKPASDGETDSINDSFSFEFVNQDGYGFDIKAAYAEQLYPQALKEFFDNVAPAASDLHLTGSVELGGYMRLLYGWVAFTGTPKGETGWPTAELDGQNVYCRSVSVSTEDGVHWTARKSCALEPLALPKRIETVGASGIPEDIIVRDLAVGPLRSASLYVGSLDRTYTLTDPAALDKLSRAMTQNGSMGWDKWASLPDSCTSVDPMVLEYADGGKRLVYLYGDGSDGYQLWDDGWEISLISDSFYELFGVEKEAAGYRVGDGGTVTALCEDTWSVETRPLDGSVSTASESVAYSYDEKGRLASVRTERVWDRQPEPDMPEEQIYLTELDYDGQDRVVAHRYYWTSVEGFELHESAGYTYDERGLLTESVLDHGQGEWAYQVRTVYEYDDEGRLTAKHIAQDGMDQLEEYWYDSDGVCHQYVTDAMGNRIDPVSGTDLPARREQN